jgi:hypothetical protein
LFGRFNVRSERFLNYGAPPLVLTFTRQACFAQTFNQRRKILRRRGQVEDVVAPGLSLGVHLFHPGFQTHARFLIVEVAGEVIQPFSQPVPGFRFDGFGRELIQVVAQSPAKFFIAHFGPRHPDDRKVLGQEIAFFKVIERRDELSFREVAGSAEDDEDAGRISAHF